MGTAEQRDPMGWGLSHCSQHQPAQHRALYPEGSAVIWEMHHPFLAWKADGRMPCSKSPPHRHAKISTRALQGGSAAAHGISAQPSLKCSTCCRASLIRRDPTRPGLHGRMLAATSSAFGDDLLLSSPWCSKNLNFRAPSSHINQA